MWIGRHETGRGEANDNLRFRVIVIIAINIIFFASVVFAPWKLPSALKTTMVSYGVI